MKLLFRIVRVGLEGVIGFGSLVFVWKIAAGAGRFSPIERVAGLLFFGAGAFVMLLYLVEQRQGLIAQIRQGTISPWKKNALGWCGITMGVGVILFGPSSSTSITSWLVYLAGLIFCWGCGFLLLFKKV